MFAWQFTITAYNPLARSVTGFVRVPVNTASYHVKGPSGKAVPSQVSSIAHLNSALVKAWASLHFLVIFGWVAIILEFFCELVCLAALILVSCRFWACSQARRNKFSIGAASQG